MVSAPVHVRQRNNPPAQHQDHQPGVESAMHPEPLAIRKSYRGAGKLEGKIALISGGDSGIGRAVALHFAREGADLAIVYLEETEDARKTQADVQAEGQRCVLIEGDLRDPATAEMAVRRTLEVFGRLDVLVNNAAEQHPVDAPEDITPEQLRATFETNLFGYVYLVQAALPHLGKGAAIINTGSVTAARGSKNLIDYASTKGAIQSLTFSLATALAPRGIRVNGVAPGPIWTPLIPASFTADAVEKFGSNTLMKRPGQPAEVAPAYVYLASEDATVM